MSHWYTIPYGFKHNYGKHFLRKYGWIQRISCEPYPYILSRLIITIHIPWTFRWYEEPPFLIGKYGKSSRISPKFHEYSMNIPWIFHKYPNISLWLAVLGGLERPGSGGTLGNPGCGTLAVVFWGFPRLVVPWDHRNMVNIYGGFHKWGVPPSSLVGLC